MVGLNPKIIIIIKNLNGGIGGERIDTGQLEPGVICDILAGTEEEVEE